MFNKFICMCLLSLATFSCFSKTLMVKVKFNQEQHTISDAWLLKEDFPSSFMLKNKADNIQYLLLNKQNKTLKSGFVNRPLARYGAFILASPSEKKQLKSFADVESSGHYYIRIPHYESDMKSIQLKYHKASKGQRKLIEPTLSKTFELVDLN